MASRTLLQLFILSIIFNKQIETRTLIETGNFAENQKYIVNYTFLNKQFNQNDVSDRNGTVRIKDIYAPQTAYTSPESKHGIEFRNRYIIEQMLNEEADADKIKTEQPSNDGPISNTTLLPKELTPLDNSNHFSKYEKKHIEEVDKINSINNDLLDALALKTAIEKVKKELSESKYKLNDESIQNVEKEHLTHTKPVPRPKYSTIRDLNTNIHTIQSMSENSLIAEVDSGLGKIEHGEKRNHKTPEKQENDIYVLQRPNEFKIASKHDNKLKYFDNNSDDKLSLENEQYELKHLDDKSKVWVSKQINVEYTHKYEQKKKYLTDKPVERQKYLTTRHHNTNTRTTQSMTENSFITEVDSSIRKIEHSKKKNYKTPKKRENEIYELQRSNEFKIASKHDNKLKYIDNKSHEALSQENELYELKHLDDKAKVWVSKQINVEYTPKYEQKKKYLTDKPVERQKYLTTRHHNTNTRTTQSMTENSSITEVDSGIRKIEHREKRNHKTPKKRENEIYELQRSNEFKTASKHDNNLKYIDTKSHEALSQENEQYELKHVDDKAKVWVSKQINVAYTQIHKQNKKFLTDKPVKRLKYLPTRPHNTNTRTTQAMTENSFVTAVDSGIRKIEHREKRNHKTPENRENDIYELQRHNEFKIASKHDNKLKYIDNKSHEALSQENEQYELKHVDNKAEALVSKQINVEYTPKYKQKKKHLTDKPVKRLKYSLYNANTRTAQSMTENAFITEVDSSIRKIEHRKKKDKQYELKNVDDTAEVLVSKQINLENTPEYKRHFQKKKHHDDRDIVAKDKHSDKIKQNSKIKHDLETYQDEMMKDEGERILVSGGILNPDEVGTQTLEKNDTESRKTLKRENKGSKLKHRHNKKTNTMSLENEMSTLKKHRNDFQKEEVKVSKQVNKLNKPKFSQNYQKKKYDKIANKNKHIGKPKNKSEEVISNIYKNNFKNKQLYFITKRYNNILRKDERDKLKADEKDIRTVKKLVGRQGDRQADEEATLHSSEEPFKQDKNFRLPFYISTTILTTKAKDLKRTKKKRENKTQNEMKNRNNDIVLNQTINRLVSSKIFDFITDRVVGKMLKKLESRGRNLLSEHQFKAKTEVKPDKVEQIDIYLKTNGEMQVEMSRENERETEKNNSGDIEAFYLQ